MFPSPSLRTEQISYIEPSGGDDSLYDGGLSASVVPHCIDQTLVMQASMAKSSRKILQLPLALQPTMQA